ncbi:unnamed protein product [Mytilus coruscus]|uniref:B box-type domain-containing protein n=1 Tax=Mytilus coruscus TaxID=42192 RepID=A0A6J8EBK5_MYTCO|nr:unnamed protein product [Mytilus coruscus]
MASSKPLPCGPCQEGKVNTKAEFWCYSCEEGLCSKCSGHHKRSKSSRDHKTIDIKSYKPSIRAIKTECGKHGQQLNMYCPSHLMPCCDECVSITHSKCTGIKSLASVVEKTKIDQSTQSLEKQINSIKYFLEKLVTNKSKNISRSEREYESIQDFIVEIRKKINIHLTNLEKKLCNEAETIWNQEKSKATDVISEIEGKQKNLNKMQDQLQTVYIRLNNKYTNVNNMWKIWKRMTGPKEFDIKMRQNDEIEKILSKLESLESLGKVTSVKTNVDLNKDTSVRREAQVESREQTNIRNMTMNIETKIEINMKKVISDMICLMDGRVIVVEKERSVKVLTSYGKLKKQLPISGKAYGVTQINQNTIAITYPFEIAIKIFNMENEIVTKFITLDKKCWDLEGNTLKSIQIESQSDLENIVYCNDRVIYSNFDGNAVCCYGESGKQFWQNTQDLKGPGGLCTDTYGNIIVADYYSGRIVVISKDGQDSKVLISEEIDWIILSVFVLNIMSLQVLFVITNANTWQHSIYLLDNIHTDYSNDITFL